MTGRHWHNTFGLEHGIPFLSVFCSVAQRSDLDLEEPPSIISQSYRVGGMDSNLCLCGNKGAVEQITKVLAKELGPRAIRVNTVSPGPVDTELFRAGKTDEQIRQPAGLAALGRIGTPEDIADMVGLLVDPQAGRNFVTVSRSGRLSCLHIDEISSYSG